MLFHKDGIKWMISEITVLIGLVDKYWSYSQALNGGPVPADKWAIEEFRNELNHFTNKHSNKSLGMIEQHAKNVTYHLTNETHYKNFIQDITCLDFTKLVHEEEVDDIKNRITEIQECHELLTRKCYYFHELIIKIIPEIISLNLDVQRYKPHSAIKILINDLESCKFTLEEIESASKHMAKAIYEINPICDAAIKSIQKLRAESLNTHWIYSNIGSWFDKLDNTVDSVSIKNNAPRIMQAAS